MPICWVKETYIYTRDTYTHFPFLHWEWSCNFSWTAEADIKSLHPVVSKLISFITHTISYCCHTLLIACFELLMCQSCFIVGYVKRSQRVLPINKIERSNFLFKQFLFTSIFFIVLAYETQKEKQSTTTSIPVYILFYCFCFHLFLYFFNMLYITMYRTRSFSQSLMKRPLLNYL